jgi:voltage-gated potassium channel
VVSGVIVAVLIAGIAIREAERGAPDANIRTTSDGLWWAATTITTAQHLGSTQNT